MHKQIAVSILMNTIITLTALMYVGIPSRHTGASPKKLPHLPATLRAVMLQVRLLLWWLLSYLQMQRRIVRVGDVPVITSTQT